jgi:hypothetical protein
MLKLKNSTTELHKEVIRILLQDGYIVGNEKYGYRVRSPEHLVLRKFGVKTFTSLKPLLRLKEKTWLLDKRIVRQLHGRHWIKTFYKTIQKRKSKAQSHDTGGSIHHGELFDHSDKANGRFPK